ncbi:hypothetical protein RSOL_375780 [Rhizoctonia solani AG-3 Rhs1AP]|uniref:Uncharacterized protein n=2 Tax=Rhizoctonia solani AG-3 TaxID=1086053 RepID=A0A074S4G9_9AGAM|nr:hypothetical protein RSOL_375780 [Rhizoctonia solani AG-3 Rhs1AP]KEP45022.1 hypothetical protein V565_328750 [Rhizoctonia solani 123E]
MSRPRSTTISVFSQVSYHPSLAPSTIQSQEPEFNQQKKERNRRTTVCGDSHTLYFRSPSHINTVNIKQKSHASPKQHCASPKPVLDYRKLGRASLPSLFDSTRIITHDEVIDGVIRNLVGCVKEFKAPAELDFSATTNEHPLALADKETNRPFINQLCKLAELRNELAKTPTHGDIMLEVKLRKTDTTIGRALERMKEHQLKLYDEFNKSTVLEHPLHPINDCVTTFGSPSKPDFLADMGNNELVSLDDGKDQLFDNQWCAQDQPQDQWVMIETGEKKQLGKGQKRIGAIALPSLQRLAKFKRAPQEAVSTLQYYIHRQALIIYHFQYVRAHRPAPMSQLRKSNAHADQLVTVETRTHTNSKLTILRNRAVAFVIRDNKSLTN